MPTDIILSIKPKYAAMILNGTKTVELRKSLPRELPGKVYLYATKPVGKIVGWFVPKDMFKRITSLCSYDVITRLAAITTDELDQYYGEDMAYFCWFLIREAHQCDRHLPRGMKPPRNFVYLKEPCASCLCWDFPGCEACLKVKKEEQ